MEQELLTLLEHLNSPRILVGFALLDLYLYVVLFFLFFFFFFFFILDNVPLGSCKQNSIYNFSTRIDLFTLHYKMIFVIYIHESGDLNRGDIIKPLSNLVPHDAFLEEPTPGTFNAT